MIIQEITNISYNGLYVRDNNLFEHEHIYVCKSERFGFTALIAIHSTVNEQAIGGCRYKEYTSFEAALNDVLRLSKAMSLKNKLCGVPFGGGKSVIIKSNNISDKKQILHEYSKFLNKLGGTYLTAQDIGISLDDIKLIKKNSEYVLCDVDPGPYTAKGIFNVINLVSKKILDLKLNDITTLIQGYGSVGSNLANHLTNSNSKVLINDSDKKVTSSFIKNKFINVKNIFKEDCTIFSPCAVGGTIDRHFAEHINVKAIIGGANNQLASNDVADLLFKKNILYVPDFLINSGGVIGLTQNYLNKTDNEISNDLLRIAENACNVIVNSKKNNLHPLKFIQENLL